MKSTRKTYKTILSPLPVYAWKVREQGDRVILSQGLAWPSRAQFCPRRSASFQGKHNAVIGHYQQKLGDRFPPCFTFFAGLASGKAWAPPKYNLGLPKLRGAWDPR